MKLFIISFSLIALVSAYEKLTTIHNGQYRHISTKPVEDSPEIFEDDLADDQQSPISFNFEQQRNGDTSPIEGRKENTRHYFRVRRPKEKRKIFHIRRGNMNNYGESIRLHSRPFTTVPTLQQYLQRDEVQENNPMPESDEIPENLSIPDSFLLPEDEGTQENEEIPENVGMLENDGLPSNDESSEVDKRPESDEMPNNYYNADNDEIPKVGEMPNSYDNAEDDGIPKGGEMSNNYEIPESSESQEDTDNNPMDTDNSPDFIENSQDSEKLSPNMFTTEIEESYPKEVEIKEDSDEKIKFQPAINTLNWKETSGKISEPLFNSEFHTRNKSRLSRLPYRGRYRFQNPEESYKNDFVSTEVEPQPIKNIETDEPAISTNADKYYVEKITTSTSKTNTIPSSSTAPFIEIIELPSTETAPRLRRRRRRKFRKNKRRNTTPQSILVTEETIIQQEFFNVTRVTSIDLKASQESNEDNVSKKVSSLEKNIENNADATTTQSPTSPSTSTSIDSETHLPQYTKDNVQLSPQRYWLRPKFRKYSRLNNVPHISEKVAVIKEDVVTSTQSPQRYRGRHKFRKSKVVNNMPEDITDNIAHSDIVTLSTIQPTTNFINIVKDRSTTLGSLNNTRDNPRHRIVEHSKPFIRRRLRPRTTTTKPEIIITTPNTNSVMNLSSTEKPRRLQQSRMRFRNRYSKNRIQLTTPPSSMISITVETDEEVERTRKEDIKYATSNKQSPDNVKVKSPPPPVPTLSPWYDGYRKK